MAFSSILEHTIFSLSMKSIRSNNKKNPPKIVCMHTQTSRISVLITAMVTNRTPLNINSLFIHAVMHDGSHE